MKSPPVKTDRSNRSRTETNKANMGSSKSNNEKDKNCSSKKAKSIHNTQDDISDCDPLTIKVVTVHPNEHRQASTPNHTYKKDKPEANSSYRAKRTRGPNSAKKITFKLTNEQENKVWWIEAF